jgi:hypothetical protein
MEEIEWKCPSILGEPPAGSLVLDINEKYLRTLFRITPFTSSGMGVAERP